MRIQPLRWLAQLVIGASLLLPAFAAAQDGAAQFPKEKLDQLTAQIALYPDSLLAQVLMASTYPDDVAEAAKWSRANSEQKGDEAVKMVESQPWDPSVQSLVAFPQVIIMMGEKPDWVRDLGDAFLAQPEDVMDSVQRLRAQAQKAGNLKSNEQVKVSTQPAEPRETQTVVVQQAAPPPQVIVIEQTQPQVVYVPSYNPTYIYGPWPYPAYPPYYVPYPPGYWFSGFVTAGIAWGVGVGISNALWGGCNWGRGDVNINVNRYNNINVNKRIDVNNNKWSHNVQNRKGTPYRGGDATRAKLDRKYQSNQREQFRGRDADRARATQTMQNRGVNMDRGSAMDRAKAMDRAGVPDRMQAQNRAGAGSRDLNRDGGGKRDLNRGGSATRDFDRNGARDRAQAADRQAIQSKATMQNRDNALHGAGDRQARQTMDRGASSRQSMQSMQSNRGGGGGRPQMQGGGGSARPQMQGGGGGARPQMQRSGGGGGGGARAGGGGGGGHGRGR